MNLNDALYRQHASPQVCDAISVSQCFWFTAAETERDLLSINNPSVSRPQVQQQKPAAGFYQENRQTEPGEPGEPAVLQERQRSKVTARTVRTQSEQVY